MLPSQGERGLALKSLQEEAEDDDGGAPEDTGAPEDSGISANTPYTDEDFFMVMYMCEGISWSCTCGRAKPGRFGSLAFAMKNRHFGGENSRILAGKARKCGRFWVLACVQNPSKQSIWRQCPPSAGKQNTKKMPNRPVFAHVHGPAAARSAPDLEIWGACDLSFRDKLYTPPPLPISGHEALLGWRGGGMF